MAATTSTHYPVISPDVSPAGISFRAADARSNHIVPLDRSTESGVAVTDRLSRWRCAVRSTRYGTNAAHGFDAKDFLGGITDVGCLHHDPIMNLHYRIGRCQNLGEILCGCNRYRVGLHCVDTSHNFLLSRQQCRRESVRW